MLFRSAYNDANELASSTYGPPISDKNGNLTSQPGFGGPTLFIYDLNNRATSISGPSVSAAMKYFGNGKFSELDSAGASHRYLIDPTASGNRILAELDLTGAMLIGYVYGPLGMISQVTSGQTYTYSHNLQGSTVALVDSTGTLKNTYRYDPFGQQLPGSVEPVPNAFVFLGRFSVPSIGPYSVTGHRIYDSAQGRFTSPDPAATQSPGFGPYIYGNQSPLTFIDPAGLTASSANSLSGVTAGSTALSGVPIDASDLADLATQVGKDLAPAGYELIPDGAGAWQIVKRDPFGNLETVGQVVDIVSLAVQLGVSIKNGNATLGTVWSATGKTAGCAVLSEGT